MTLFEFANVIYVNSVLLLPRCGVQPSNCPNSCIVSEGMLKLFFHHLVVPPFIYSVPNVMTIPSGASNAGGESQYKVV